PADPAIPAGFRSQNLVPHDVPLYGPWHGVLDNSTANVELARPDIPTTNGAAYILVDRVKYSSNAPWPGGASGFGLTLQRIVPSSYGNDPTNWVAVAPTPGEKFVGYVPPPMVISQPGDRLIPTGTDVILSATGAGGPPLRYQWRFNGLNLAGATSPTLILTNFQFSQAGVYNILVYNGAGSA